MPYRKESMPTWTLESLRDADPLLVAAVIMLLGVVLADALHRLGRVPRAMGLMVVGTLASPFVLGLIERNELDPWKPLLDLAIGALVFELGSRIQLRWLFENRWLAASSVLEGVVAGVCVAVLLTSLGVAPLSAWMAAAVAMSTSPVIIMAAMHELRPRGQVTERLLMTTALNSVLAMLALKAWRVVAAAGTTAPASELFSVAASAVYVVCGSFLLGVVVGYALSYLMRGSDAASTVPVLQISLVVLATLIAAHWKLSPLLALLIAGVTARGAMSHRLTVEPHLGSAGAVLNVLLFVSLGLLFSFDGFMQAWAWALAIIVARLAGKALVLAAMARWSHLGWRQTLALTIALQPMSTLAVLLAADTFSWPSQFPGVDANILHALLLATSVMQLFGPMMAQLALRRVAGECGSAPKAA